jgi:hypothetical protein
MISLTELHPFPRRERTVHRSSASAELGRSYRAAIKRLAGSAATIAVLATISTAIIALRSVIFLPQFLH